MRMNLPNQLVDHQTGELIDLSEFELYFKLGIEKTDTAYINNYIDSFELIEKIGFLNQSRDGFTQTHIHFRGQSDRIFHLGIVLQKKGVFLLVLGLPSEYGIAELAEKEEDRLKVINSSCTYQDVTRYSGVRFNDGNINYYLLSTQPCQQASPTDNLTFCNPDSTTTANRGGYVFIVDW